MSLPALSADRPRVVSRWHTARCAAIAALIGAACTYGATLYTKPISVRIGVIESYDEAKRLWSASQGLTSGVHAVLTSKIDDAEKNRRIECLLSQAVVVNAGHKYEGKCV